MRQRLTLLAVLFPIIALPQRGPDVPCPECKGYPVPSYPETGWWYNPDEPGTGFNIEIQNGYLLGAYYGFDKQGQPAWYLFQGLLEPGRDDSFYSIDAELQSYVDGSCLTCDHVPVVASESPGTIQVDFFQRNHATFSVSGEIQQFVVPLVYGTAASVDYPQTEYAVPDLEGFWVVVVENPDPAYGPRWGRKAEYVRFGNKGLRTDEDGNAELLAHVIFTYPAPPEILAVGTIECRRLNLVPDELPACTITYVTSYPGSGGLVPLEFRMPIANIGDSRVEAATPEGILFKAIRVDYD